MLSILTAYQRHVNMKKFTALFLTGLISLAIFAQEEETIYEKEQQDEYKTIFRRKDGRFFVSGFGGPIMSFSTIENNFAHMMGGGGGIIINNFFLGGYGLGLTTPLDFKGFSDNSVPDSSNVNLEFGHGGLWAGYIIAPRKPIHLSISAQFGWGNISSQLDYGLAPVSVDKVFVATPIVELELNFSHFFKVGLGSSVSYVRGPGITNTDYTVQDFMKPSFYLTFKFGWFN